MVYSPTTGGALEVNFPLQFPTAKITPASVAVTPVEQLSPIDENAIISHGTGFFWRYDDDVFLVTARHVATGRNPFTNELMSSNGFIPQRFRFYPTMEVGSDQWGRGTGRLEYESLGDEDWLEDPDFDELRTDIAAIRLNSLKGVKVRCLNDEPIPNAPVMASVGFECAVVGYPQAKVGGLMTPIWRRGTFASEPLLPIDGKPMFLLDASTSPGFSGSPVFRRHVGPVPKLMADGAIEVDIDNIVTTEFIGVYAGRLQHTHFGGEVPFVFYGNRIPFILGASVKLRQR